MRVAAVDVGTNTVRLLVADAGDATAHIERDSRITRLGEGVDATSELGAEPMQRTLEAVREFVDRARAAGAQSVRVAGTSALRDARNTRVFVQEVEAATGVVLDILDGTDEGRVAYAGATSWLGEGSYVVCDIGGGSTELISETETVSVDLGSVRVRERYLPGDPPAPDDVRSARAAVRGVLDGLGVRRVFAQGDLIGVAGTITTVAALDAGLERYDSDVVHGYVLSAEAAEDWAERLNMLTVADVRALGPVKRGRADVIGAGALVLCTVMEVLQRASMTVSERDILDGLVLQALG